MKLTTFILIVTLMQVSAASFGQKFTLKQRGITLEDIILEIRNQTGYDVLVGTNKFQSSKRIDANFKDSQLSEVMDKVVKVSGMSYSIEGKTIVIKEKEAPSFLDQIMDHFANIGVRGRILDEQKNPLPGATVKVKGANQTTVTNEKGEFYLPDVSEKAVLIIAYVGYAQREINVAENLGDIILGLSDNKLEEVNVTVNTGYQTLPKERATGSFSYVDNKLLNRSVSNNVLDRLEGVTSGVLFNKVANRLGGPAGKGGDPGISIRGRSTLFANTDPLVVLDNFPYDGDVNNINPNDIESVTILKDAAAASIWGVRAGNGVIVLTSKKGRLNQIPSVSFNASLNLSGKPDLYKVPQMTSKEYIEYEKFLFENGKYDFQLTYQPYIAQSPVVDLLDKIRNNPANAEALTKQLNDLEDIDSREDYSKYFLRTALNQQYALNISGGNDHNQYYISGGYDQNLANIVSNSSNRVNLKVNNTYQFFNAKISLNTNLMFTKSRTRQNPNPFSIQFPYEKLVGGNENGLSVIRDFRQIAKDGLSSKGLADWNYYPFNERLTHNDVSNLSEYLMSLQFNYKILPEILTINLNYQYQQSNMEHTISNDPNSYNNRLLINRYAQIAPSGEISYPVPLGSLVNLTNSDFHSNSARAGINYHQKYGTKHELTMIGGIEVKDNNLYSHTQQLYGYQSSTATSTPVDYFTDYDLAIDNGIGRIPFLDNQSGSVDRFFSYFANASYIFYDRYGFSGSLRKDESNLFGVDANKKGVPLYSLGLSWEISKEPFYKVPVFPYLRVRLTDGYNGNLSRNLSAFTTAREAGISSAYNAPQEVIVNPPNPMLSWEKVHIINAGLDFQVINNTFNGSVDYFIKSGQNLIGSSSIAPQTGITEFIGNSAATMTNGLDLILNSNNLRGAFGWTTNLIFNYTRDKVTEYKIERGLNSLYVASPLPNPFVGKPYSAIFAYPWAGLDNLGNPQTILDGKLTTDYSTVLNSIDPTNIKYIGPATPKIFGSIRNNFTYHHFNFSFNISYKLGYYFRRGSFSSSNTSYQQADFSARWINPGDQRNTNVPALIYPSDSSRDLIYRGSEILVERGDHFRLQDIQLAYDFVPRNSSSPFRKIKIYAYLSNLGIIWKRNKVDLDPDYAGNGYYQQPVSRSCAIGLMGEF